MFKPDDKKWMDHFSLYLKMIFFILPLITSSVFADSNTPHGRFPNEQAIQKCRDDQALDRAVTAYRFWYPTVSAEAIFSSNREMGIKDNEGICTLMIQPHHVGFTLNSDLPYAGGVLDLTQGPIVIDLPAGPFIGWVNDHHQRWVIDLGIPGQDEGHGGKYLILPPDYKGKIPAGDYHVASSASYKAFLTLRYIPVKGDLNAAMKHLKEVKVYPVSTAGNPKYSQFIDATNVKMDMTPLRFEKNLRFWEVLQQVINDEPIVEEFLPMYGLLATLGIEKGKPFNPDQKMKALLEKAAQIGHEQMLVAAFASGKQEKMAWSDRKWEWLGLVSNTINYKTLADLNTEACDRWFIQAIGSSPALFRRAPGADSLYWLGIRDKNGVYLEGGNNYKLVIPQPVPCNGFWSLTIYDAATRSQIQTDQNKASLRSLFELKNADKSKPLEIYFGPTPVVGKEDFWIKTIPGKNWFVYLRIYGPEQAAFDGRWKPGDFEKI